MRDPLLDALRCWLEFKIAEYHRLGESGSTFAWGHEEAYKLVVKWIRDHDCLYDCMSLREAGYDER